MKTYRNRRVIRKTTRRFLGGNMEWYKITQIKLEDYVKCLKPLYSVIEHKNKSKSNPDIFLKTILAGHSGMTSEQWDVAEKQRLYEKALSMKMGDFHEELMGKFAGYETLPLGHKTGMDVRKIDDTEYIEVKNRDITMNSGSAESVVRKLTKLVDDGKSSILVMVNTEKKTLPRFKAPKEVKVMSGRQVYAYLSGDEMFYDNLIETLNSTFKRYQTYPLLEAEVLRQPQHVPT